MTKKRIIRRFLLLFIILLLLFLAWEAIAGGARQFSGTNTFGQQLETIVQIACGLLSMLVVITCFWWQFWAKIVRISWIVSLVLTAGLSALVWGPPMPLMALVFATVALIVALTIVWALQRLCNDGINKTESNIKFNTK